MQMRGRYYVCASALSVYFLECARLRDSSLLVCEPNYYVNKVQVYGSGIGDWYSGCGQLVMASVSCPPFPLGAWLPSVHCHVISNSSSKLLDIRLSCAWMKLMVWAGSNFQSVQKHLYAQVHWHGMKATGNIYRLKYFFHKFQISKLICAGKCHEQYHSLALELHGHLHLIMSWLHEHWQLMLLYQLGTMLKLHKSCFSCLLAHVFRPWTVLHKNHAAWFYRNFLFCKWS